MLWNVTVLGGLHAEDKGTIIPESVFLNKVILCVTCYIYAICVWINLTLERVNDMSCIGLCVSGVITDTTLL